MAEQAAHNRCVAGSSPATATPDLGVRCASGYAALHVRVAASTLVRRSCKSNPVSEEGTPPWPRRPTSVRRSPGVYGVQGAQLHHAEEPPQRPGPHRAEEVLPPGRQAHRAPRDPLTRTATVSARPVRGPPYAVLVRAGRFAPCRWTVLRRPEYPPTAPYLVGREKIREFADAIGATDAGVPRPGGGPRARAIRTWWRRRRSRSWSPWPPAGRSSTTRRWASTTAGWCTASSASRYTRPVVAGDELVCVNTVEEITSRGGHDFLTTRTEVTHRRPASRSSPSGPSSSCAGRS